MKNLRRIFHLSWQKLIVLLVISVATFFLLNKTFDLISKYRVAKKTDKYSQIHNWQDAKDVFDDDLKKDELKYFCFGLAYNRELDTLKTKYKLDVIFMGDIITSNYVYYDHYVEIYLFKREISGKYYKTQADSIWEYFVRALETKDIEYLIANSFDTIKCAELNIPSKNDDDRYPSKFIFENHLDKLKHLENLSMLREDIYESEGIIRVNYKIECKADEEDGYNLIFMFEKIGDKYFFSRMIMT